MTFSILGFSSKSGNRLRELLIELMERGNKDAVTYAILSFKFIIRIVQWSYIEDYGNIVFLTKFPTFSWENFKYSVSMSN